MEIQIPELLTALATVRPVFHSEADFQHALAWQLQKQHPELSIRLEYRVPLNDDRMYIDVWATDAGGRVTALELKYKKRRLQAVVNNEAFDLTDQSAQDLARYDTIKDVCRLERVVAARGPMAAYVVLLTNDRSYWSPARSEATVDAPFRLHEGRVLCGDCGWGVEATAGTIKNREMPLRVSGAYPIEWRDYSTVSTVRSGQFRSMTIRIA